MTLTEFSVCAPWLQAARRKSMPWQLCVCDRALGTSGAGHQYFYHQGRRYGHVIDPRTGFPAERVLAATATAPTGAEADALATAFYVLGPEATESFCRNRPEIAALLVVGGQRASSIELLKFNISDELWRPI